MFCQHCKRDLPDAAITTYPVHYGKKIGTETTSQMVQPNMMRTTKTTSYEVCGQTTLDLCANCVQAHRWKWRTIGLAAIVGGIMIMGTFGNSIPALGIAGLPVVLIGIPVFLWSLGRGFGARWARGLVHDSFGKQSGYDSFWTESEFKNLTPAGR